MIRHIWFDFKALFCLVLSLHAPDVLNTSFVLLYTIFTRLAERFIGLKMEQQGTNIADVGGISWRNEELGMMSLYKVSCYLFVIYLR